MICWVLLLFLFDFLISAGLFFDLLIRRKTWHRILTPNAGAPICGTVSWK